MCFGLGTSCLTSCLCGTAASCCTSLCCRACGDSSSCSRVCTKSVQTRVAFVAQFLVFSCVAWVMSNWAEKLLYFIPELHLCPTGRCFGILATYRITFGMGVFHAIMAAALVGVRRGSETRAALQDGFWPLKVLAQLALIVVSFFIPNKFFTVYGWVAIGGAAAFVLIQLVLLVGFAHSWSESWAANMEDEHERTGGRRWLAALAAATVVMYVACAVMVVLVFVFFTHGGTTCWRNGLFVSVSALACVCFSVLAVHPRVRAANPRSGLLQAALVSLYSIYLVWSAIFSEPRDWGCNPWSSHGAGSEVTLVIGAVLTVVAVCYTTMTMSTRSQDFFGDAEAQRDAGADVRQSLLAEMDADERRARGDANLPPVATESGLPLKFDSRAPSSVDGDADRPPRYGDDGVPLDPSTTTSSSSSSDVIIKDGVAKQASIDGGMEEVDVDAATLASAADDGDDATRRWTAVDDEKDGTQYSYSFFHVVFVLGSMYIAEILTNYHAGLSPTNNGLDVDTGKASVWVKLASGWAVIVLYVWSLIAPLLFPNRQFSPTA